MPPKKPRHDIGRTPVNLRNEVVQRLRRSAVKIHAKSLSELAHFALRAWERAQEPERLQIRDEAVQLAEATHFGVPEHFYGGGGLPEIEQMRREIEQL